jgi:hypothetical protein
VVSEVTLQEEVFRFTGKYLFRAYLLWMPDKFVFKMLMVPDASKYISLYFIK